MTGALAHRGPDAQDGVLLDGVALGHTRLSIVDLEGGQQPMRDPCTGTCVVLNGEIFNYLELRDELREYPFRTRSDTEVILAAYQRWGIGCVERFLGQWAFALWDPVRRQLHLSRDRLGIRPLYYAETPCGVVFASEVKALFASSLVEPVLDPLAIKETTCLWAPISPRTTFQGVLALPPACCGLVTDGRVRVRRYWTLDLSDRAVDPSLTMDRAVPLVAELLDDAVRLRLRADVPVGSYLSGGLDSSLICALAQARLRATGSNLSTFSVAFSDATYDESAFQRRVATQLATDHHELVVTDRCIGELLPEVVRLAEQPLVRSAPAPLLALSRVVRDHRTKVVLTGEGADEFFWGYQLYQETKIREWGSRRPRSNWGGLLQRVYADLRVGEQSPALLKAFWSAGLDEPEHPGFSHLLRWSSTARIWRFFSREFSERVLTHDPVQVLLATAPAEFSQWRPLARAQFLEMHTLLSGYLLSAQGDRMLMGNSVEGRFPFLDHRLVELAARLPDSVKLRVLDEKWALKRIAAPLLPAEILHRPKRPYRAPVAEALAGPDTASWTREALEPDAVDAVGVFDSRKTEGLRRKLSERGVRPSESDNMAVMAIASVQLLHQQLVRAAGPPHPARTPVRVMTAASTCDAGAA
jgi:asparagine synthase (glutamine-hydrolysing)